MGNVNEAVKELEKYKKSLKGKVNEFLKAMIEYGVEISKAKIIELGAVDDGELLNSLSGKLYKEGNKGIIFTDCLHACFVEFGTGVQGAVSPHPNPIDTWEYDTNGHGEDGWYYYDEKQGRIRFTKGMPSRPFMYETAKELEQRAVEIAREVFSR